MAIEKITMPQLGESVTEGMISKWLVAQGDRVNKYEPLAEVLTDKVTAEIPSSFSGIITEIIAPEEENLPVGAIICTIETEENAGTFEEKEEVIIRNQEEVKVDNKIRYSPAVLKLSQEHGVDLQTVKGTGKGGRISRKDLLLYIENKNKKKNIGKDTKVKTLDKGTSPETTEVKNYSSDYSKEVSTTSQAQTLNHTLDKSIPVTAVRRAIAGNMVRSYQEVPHAWMMVEVDVTNLVSYRDKIKQDFRQNEGFNLTYFAFFAKAVAQSLKEFPMLNSEWQGDQIIQRRNINLSIAVASDNALFVPVIKNADEKTIKGIAREIHELANKVRSGKLALSDTQGGTFTVNNTGSFGSVQSMGIINYPQAAILQVESIVKRPVIVNNGIFVRDMVNLCLSLDHRVLDGLICGKFLKRVKEILEEMSEETTPIY